jgi:excinuclease ABC subunit B
METAIRETERRRKIQEEYNRREGLTPETIQKSITDIRHSIYEADYFTVPLDAAETEGEFNVSELRAELRREMVAAAERLDFERAAELRDRLKELESQASLKTVRASRKKKPYKPPRRPGRKKS